MDEPAPPAPLSLADIKVQEEVHQEEAEGLADRVAIERDPATEGEVSRISEATGMPADFVRRQYDTFKPRDDRWNARSDAKGLPATTDVLNDPEHYAVGQDDTAHLGLVERIVRDSFNRFEYQESVVDYGMLGWDRMFQDTDSIDQESRLTEVEASMGRKQDESLPFPADVPGGMSEMVPTLWHTMTRSLDEAFTGTVAGAAASAALGPEAVPVGALAGFSFGMRAGMALETGKIEAGAAFNEYMTLKTLDGKPMDRNAAKAAAFLTGIANGSLEIVALDRAIKLIPGGEQLLAKISKRGMKEALQRPSTQAILKRFGKDLSIATAVEVGQEMLQELVTGLNSELAKTLDGGDYEGMDTQALWDNMQHAGYRAFLGSLGFGATGGGIRAGMEHRTKVESDRRMDAFAALGEAVNDSEMQTRLPERFAEFVKSVREAHGSVDEVFVSSEALNKFFQSTGATPEEIGQKMPATLAAAQEAALTGSLVSIPLEEFVTYVAPSEGFGALAQDITFAPDELSPRQLAEFESERESILKEWESKAGVEDAVAESDDPVFGNIAQQLQQAGYSPKVAGAYAELWSAFFTRVGDKIGVSPGEFLNQLNVAIRQEEMAGLQRGDVPTRLGSLLDTLREGRGPTQQEAFGKSAVQRLVEEGGILDEGGELSGRDYMEGMPEYGGRRLGREATDERGVSFERAFEVLRDDGYLEMDSELSGTDSVLEVIDRELGMGERVYARGTENPTAVALMEELDELESMIDAAQLDITDMTNEEVLDAIGQTSLYQEKVSAAERIGSLTALKTNEPLAYKAVQSFLGRQGEAEAKRIRDNIKEFKGTPWAVAAMKGMIIREGMYQYAEGKDASSLFTLEMWGKQNVLANGIINAFRKGDEAVALFASGYDFIGGNKKAEQDYSGSFVNCDPSKTCARWCYAATGTAYTNSLIKTEFTEIMAERHPQALADRIAQQYTMSLPSEAGLALRTNEKGDLSEAQLNVIELLNQKKIKGKQLRIQVFSKRPELLDRVADFNLRLLSVDDSNLSLAEGNEHILSVMLNDGIATEWIEENNDRVGVYLPVLVGRTGWSVEALKKEFPTVYKQMRKKLCPVDSDKLKLPPRGTSYVQIGGKGKMKGVWTCTSCDKYGSAGCFHGDKQTEAARLDKNRNTAPQGDAVVAKFLDALDELHKAGEVDNAEYRRILNAVGTGITGNEGDSLGGATVSTSEARPAGDQTEAGDQREAGEDPLSGTDADVITQLFQRAWHGTGAAPFPSFLLSKVNSGEGAQVYGWGMYFADRQSVSQWYREMGVRRGNQGGGQGIQAVSPYEVVFLGTNMDRMVEDIVNDAVEWSFNNDGDYKSYPYQNILDTMRTDIPMLNNRMPDAIKPAVPKFIDELWDNTTNTIYFEEVFHTAVKEQMENDESLAADEALEELAKYFNDTGAAVVDFSYTDIDFAGTADATTFADNLIEVAQERMRSGYFGMTDPDEWVAAFKEDDEQAAELLSATATEWYAQIVDDLRGQHPRAAWDTIDQFADQEFSELLDEIWEDGDTIEQFKLAMLEIEDQESDSTVERDKFARLIEGQFTEIQNIKARYHPGDGTVPSKGSLMRVEIPEDDALVHWDIPLHKQYKGVKDKLEADGWVVRGLDHEGEKNENVRLFVNAGTKVAGTAAHMDETLYAIGERVQRESDAAGKKQDALADVDMIFKANIARIQQNLSRINSRALFYDHQSHAQVVSMLSIDDSHMQELEVRYNHVEREVTGIKGALAAMDDIPSGDFLLNELTDQMNDLRRELSEMQEQRNLYRKSRTFTAEEAESGKKAEAGIKKLYSVAESASKILSEKLSDVKSMEQFNMDLHETLESMEGVKYWASRADTNDINSVLQFSESLNDTNDSEIAWVINGAYYSLEDASSQLIDDELADLAEELDAAANDVKAFYTLTRHEAPVGGMTGEEFYKLLEARSRDDSHLGQRIQSKVPGHAGMKPDEIASRYLDTLDIPGLRYRDGPTRNKGGNYTYNYVVWNTDALEIIRVLEQSMGEDKGPRGYLEFDDLRRFFNITLTGQANLSTFIHESGHFFLEVLNLAATRTPDPDLQMDMEEIFAWLDVPNFESIGVAEHEKFARGFEAYILEGKAPTSRLAEAFRMFRGWLLQVYKSIRNLNVDLDKSIREVFDRMLGADESVEALSVDYPPMYESAKDAGMTDEQFQAYLRLHQTALTEAKDEMQAEITREIAREKNKAYRLRKKQLRETITEEVNSRPVYAVQRFLRGANPDEFDVPDEVKGKKMDSDAILRLFPNTRILRAIPGLFKKGGLHPDTVGELFNYRDGYEMIQEIVAAPPRKDVIDQLVQGELDKEYGGMFIDGTAVEEAEQALHNNAMGTFLMAELKSLNRKVGRDNKTTVNALAKTAARNKVRRTPMVYLNPQKYRQAEKKAGRQATEATAAGNFEEALQFKQQQLLNHHLYKESAKARESYERHRKALDKYTKLPARQRIGKASPQFLDVIDGYLEGVELKKVSGRQLDRRQHLQEFIAQQEANGFEVIIPPELIDQTKLKNYKQMSLEELEGLRDAVEHVAHMARMKGKLLVNGQRRDLRATVDGIDAAMEKNVIDRKKKGEFTKTYADRFRDGVEMVQASLTKMEFLTLWIDGGQPGIAHETLFQPVADAQHARNDKLKSLHLQLQSTFQALTSTGQEHMTDQVQFLGENMYIHQVYAVALNMGNAGNIEKLIEGYDYLGWTYDSVLNELQRHLNRDDWVAVQEIWHTINSLWPDLERVYRTQTGVAPAKVEAVPLYIKEYDLVLEGGYYPVVYDSTKDMAGVKQEVSNLFDGKSLRSTVTSSATKERSGYTGPLLLSLDVIGSHLNEVVHYSTHYEAVAAINKVINDPAFKASITKTFGHNHWAEMKAWLENIAQDGAPTNEAKVITKFSQVARYGLSLGAMGYNVSSAMMQAFGLFTSASELGAKDTAAGIIALYKDRAKNVEFVDSHSGEVRHIMKTMDREISAFAQDLVLPTKGITSQAAKWMRNNAFFLMAAVQREVNRATWLGAYGKAMRQKETHMQAVNYADSVVRTTQSGAGQKDMARIQRGGEFAKLMTAFYTYFSVLYNRLRQSSTKHLRDDRGKIMGFGSWTRQMGWLIIMPTMVDAIMKGRMPDDDTEPYEWWWQVLAMNLTYAATSVPILRDIAPSTLAWYFGISDYRPRVAPPALQLVEKAVGVGKLGVEVLTDEKDLDQMTDRELRLVADTINMTGIPTKQLNKWYEWMSQDDLEAPVREFLFGVRRD